MKPDESTRPSPDAVGWCHNCETWQRGSAARWQYVDWAEGYEWLCVVCDDEPWGLGVWIAGQGNSLDACGCHGEHADAQLVAYGCPR